MPLPGASGCYQIPEPHHSVFHSWYVKETVFVLLVDALYLEIDTGNCTPITLLDSSVAFDTVDHEVLTMHLCNNAFICGTVLSWFHFLLVERCQRAAMGECLSLLQDLSCGSQGVHLLAPLVQYVCEVTGCDNAETWSEMPLIGW